MKQNTLPDSRSCLVAELKDRLERLVQARRGAPQVVSTGCEDLDKLIPGRGLSRGTLVEWLAPGPGSGAGSLALAVAREACRDGGPVVVVDRAGCFYPPAAAQARVDLDRLIVVRPANAADETWALDQSLRSPGVAAVLCWAERLAARTWRRLQLAAESAGNLGLFIRPATARGESSWANVRFLVEPQPTGHQRRLRVELLRLRGTSGGQTLDLELDDETGVVRLAPRLADPAVVRRAARAS
ncbi:MAG: hypothetical protein HYX69_13815 [Planctomycetia bacterium]|nr:hypothetical protein [Planctomycetia bacterium]